MTTELFSPEDFQACRARWTALVAAGEFEEALELTESAVRWARLQDDPVLLDRTLCNRAAIAIELGREGSWVAELRSLLMRSDDAENGFLAAYTIARHYELTREPRKGLFYAQLARDRAIDSARRGSSVNLIANFQVSGCRFEEAIASYGAAALLVSEAGADPLRAAVIGYNIGYCLVVTGECRSGLARIYRSLRSLLAIGAARHEMLARLDLSFALLENGRPELALRHADRAQILARRFADSASRKNALYLGGAAATASGDAFGARRRFAELQADFFPDADYLPDLLLRVDVRQLVNLKA